NPFVFDDVSKVANNPDIRKLEYLRDRLVYPYGKEVVFERNDPSRPLVFATYTLNYAVGGIDPFGYHLVNALLHALNGLLAFALGRRLLRALYGEDAIAVPFAAALFFVVSPVTMGTAIYVYGRSDVMQGTFGLLAALLFFAARDQPTRAGRIASRVGALAAFA